MYEEKQRRKNGNWEGWENWEKKQEEMLGKKDKEKGTQKKVIKYKENRVKEVNECR